MVTASSIDNKNLFAVSSDRICSIRAASRTFDESAATGAIAAAGAATETVAIELSSGRALSGASTGTTIVAAEGTDDRGSITNFGRALLEEFDNFGGI